MQDTSRGDAFSRGVTVLFGAQVLMAGVGIVNGILLARLLGPAGKGDYYILVLVPATAMVLLQLGLPQAFAFFSARGKTAGILTKAFVVTAALTLAAVLSLAALLPLIREAFLQGIGLEQILFAFLVFPLALNATFTSGVVIGRQAVRWYAGIKMVDPVATTVLLLIVVLGGLGLSVNGAIAVYLVATLIHTTGFVIAAKRVTASSTAREPISYRGLFGYGLPFYPASLAGFFSYRIDAYLIAFLVADASEQLGYYSMAVALAEMVLFFPKAVGTLFFPHVAGSPREDSDRQVALVSRVTILVTGMFAILLVPAAAMMIWFILPAFGPSLPPLLVLLPGVVTLSAANVVSGYLGGIGRPGVASSVSVISLAVNIVANLVLIPRFGITGASAASLASYSLSLLLLAAVAARLSGSRATEFWVPRVSDLRFVVTALVGLLHRMRNRSRATPGDHGA